MRFFDIASTVLELAAAVLVVAGVYLIAGTGAALITAAVACAVLSWMLQGAPRPGARQ